jgi:hypothetical protein
MAPLCCNLRDAATHLQDLLYNLFITSYASATITAKHPGALQQGGNSYSLPAMSQQSMPLTVPEQQQDGASRLCSSSINQPRQAAAAVAAAAAGVERQSPS